MPQAAEHRLSPMILPVRIFLAFCLVFALSCAQEQESLVWQAFPDHPGYTREEQLYYLQRYPQGYGKVGSIINDANWISDEHMEYLIRFAENRLSYGNLSQKTGEELILISAHLTQAILRPCDFEREACVVNNVSYNTNDILLDLFREYENQQNAFCINYTMMHMGIFNGFKERYRVLERYEFLPMSINTIRHAVQGIYDRETDTLAVMCSMEDDRDGKFNAGKRKLNWDLAVPDLFHASYIDVIKILSRFDDDPGKAIAALKALEKDLGHPDNHT